MARRIGYQGERLSNAEAAAVQMAESLGIGGAEYVPLVRSDSVAAALRSGNIDYGVMAVKNSIGGGVRETFDAIRDEDFELAHSCVMEVHHCLFRHPDADTVGLSKVASHEQALRQTRETRAKIFPDLEEVEVQDTALAAQDLASGVLDRSYAILCRREAGLENGLVLVRENLEDVKPSLTEFRMLRKPSLDYSNSNAPEFRDRIMYLLVNQDGIGAGAKAALIVAFFVAAYVVGMRFADSVELASSVAGAVSALFLFLTSGRVTNIAKYRPIKGYWKYYSLADKGRESGQDLLYETPRIVEIDEVDGLLVMRGWICDKTALPFFEAEKIIVSEPGKARGTLVYWYKPPAEAGRGVSLGGFAELNWQRKHLPAKVNQMSGRYFGWATGETGTVRFLRITEEEYEVHRRCEFLGSVKAGL